jgi:hypothetical protein
MTYRIRQPGQGRKKRTARKWQQEQDSQNWVGRIQDRQKTTARTGLLGKACQDRTAGTRLPG